MSDNHKDQLQIHFDWMSDLLKYDDTTWTKEYFTPTESKCKHKWKATKLVFSTVYDCELCNIKQEDDK